MFQKHKSCFAGGNFSVVKSGKRSAGKFAGWLTAQGVSLHEREESVRSDIYWHMICLFTMQTPMKMALHVYVERKVCMVHYKLATENQKELANLAYSIVKDKPGAPAGRAGED